MMFLSEASLDDVLEYALNKQEPAQAEIRERMLREKHMKQLSDVRANLRLAV